MQIWKESPLPFAETNDILNDVNVEKLKPSEISKVCCLRDGWQYILQNISKPLDLGYMENLHELIAKGDLPHYDLGQIRVDGVLISGTSWRPEIPNPDQLHVELHELLKIPNDTEKSYYNHAMDDAKNRYSKTEINEWQL